MAITTQATAATPNATYIRRSSGHPQYVLIRFDGTDALAIVLATPSEPGDMPSLMVDGFVELPARDPRHPGATCEIFVVQDDGVNLDGDLEHHAENLAEELRVLTAEAREEFSI